MILFSDGVKQLLLFWGEAHFPFYICKMLAASGPATQAAEKRLAAVSREGKTRGLSQLQLFLKIGSRERATTEPSPAPAVKARQLAFTIESRGVTPGRTDCPWTSQCTWIVGLCVERKNNPPGKSPTSAHPGWASGWMDFVLPCSFLASMESQTSPSSVGRVGLRTRNLSFWLPFRIQVRWPEPACLRAWGWGEASIFGQKCFSALPRSHLNCPIPGQSRTGVVTPEIMGINPRQGSLVCTVSLSALGECSS